MRSSSVPLTKISASHLLGSKAVLIAKRFRPQQEQACQEVLQYVLERETDSHAANTENLDEVGGLE
jgi:hypothetical protein